MRSKISVAALFVMWMLGSQALAERPNVLFIIADDASRSSFGVYGSKYVNTPHFDRLANEGVRFENAFNCNPKCSPARACLLTGRYSWQLEEACNHQPFLSDKWVFYPYLLQDAGYFVGYTGKGWGPGVWLGEAQGGNSNNKNPAGIPYQKKTLKPPYKGISNGDYAGNFGLFLDDKPADRPFCFWLGTREPHRSYELNSYQKAGKNLDDVTVPGYYPDNGTIRGDLADYALEVEWYDTHIGRAVQELADRKLLDNTLIIATSDHGMPFPRAKGQIYEESFRVPMAVRWGEKIKPGRIVTDFVTFPDVAPTILEVAGVQLHEQMTGKSFLDVLLAEGSGRIDAARDHTLLGKERHDLGRTDGDLVSVGYPVRALRNDQYLYVKNFEPDRWPVGDPEYGFLNCDNSPTKSYLLLQQSNPEQRKFFEMSFGKRPGEELYDIKKDPDCLENLAMNEQFADVKSKMWDQLQKELTAQQDPRILGQGRIFDFYPNRSIDKAQELYGNDFYDPVERFEKEYPQQK